MIWLLIYTVFMFALVLRPGGKSGNAADFYVCGRRAGGAVVALSILASCVGSSATIGMTGLAARAGAPAFWWLGSGAAGLLVLGFFLAGKVRRSGAFTMPRIVEQYMGRQCAALASFIIMPAWLAILAAQFAALGIVVGSLCGFEAWLATSLGALVLLLHTLIGGQASVMKSDVPQFLILLAALVAMLCFAAAAPAGGQALLAMSPELVNAEFPASRLRYFLCVLGGSYIVCPMLFGRILSARSEGAARKGVFAAAAGLALVAMLITALGIACGALAGTGTPDEQVLNRAMAACMPPWARTLALLGLFSAIISSADSCLMTAAGICSHDLLGNKSIGSCRFCMVLLAAAGLFLALQGRGILELLLMANDIYVCGIVAPVFVGLAAGTRLPPCQPLMLLAMCAGGGFGLAAAWSGVESYCYAGLGSSLGLAVLALLVPVVRQAPQKTAPR